MTEAIGVEAIFETAAFQRGMKVFEKGISNAISATTDMAITTQEQGAIMDEALGNLVAEAAIRMADAVIAAVKAVIKAVVGMGKAILDTAISVESAWAGVTKTTEGLVDEFGNLTAAGEAVQGGLRDLAKSVPADLEEIMGVAELAGQLGVADEALVGFTETMIALGESTNLTAEEAASAIARIQNIFGVSTENMAANASAFGSAIVALGNNFATTEADILAFATQMAGAGKLAGLAQAEILAIAAAFTSVGVSAEAGGTAVQKVLLLMVDSIANGGAELGTFADVVGAAFGDASFSVEDFIKLFEEDAGAAFTKFVEGLGVAGDEAITILQELGLEDQRLIKAFLSLAGAGDLLADAMGVANAAFFENTALAEEAGKRYATTESQLQIFKNVLRDIAVVIGAEVLPVLNDLVGIAIALLTGDFESLEEVFGVSPDLITSFENIQEGLVGIGEEFENFFDKLSKGGFGEVLLPLLVEMLVGFIEDLAGADFSGLDTLAVFINNISRDIAKLLETGDPGPIFERLTQNIEIPAGVTKAWESLGGALDTIAEAAPGAADAVEDFADAIIIPGLKQAAERLELIGDAAKSIKDAFTPALTEGVQSFLDVIGPLSEKAGPEFASVMDDLAIKFGNAKDELDPLVDDSLIGLSDWFEENAPLIEELAGKIGERIGFMVAMIGLLGSISITNFNTMLESMEPLSSRVPEIAGLVGESVGLMATAVLEIANGDWASAWETMEEISANSSEATGIIISGFLETILGLFGTDLATVSETWGTIWDDIKIVAEEKWQAITDFFAETIPTFVTNISEGFGEMSTTAGEKFDEMKTSAETALQAMVDAAITKGTEIKDGIITAIENTITALSDKVSEFFKLGVDFIQGLINGTLSMGAALLNAIVRLVLAAISGAAAAAGAQSPSRVFMGQGEDWIAGLLIGIDKMAKLPALAMEGVVGQATSTSAGAAFPQPMLAGGGGTTVNNIDNSRTVDMGGVTQSQQSLNSLLDDLQLFVGLDF